MIRQERKQQRERQHPFEMGIPYRQLRGQHDLQDRRSLGWQLQRRQRLSKLRH